MPESKSYDLTWTVENDYVTKRDKIRFDFYGFPLELMHVLVSQLNHHIFMESSKVDFKAERAQYADRVGRSAEQQLSLDLKLKF